jgi:glycerol uptake facilitator-like aquaporin|tara:strand:+ start:428 stop:697 length:270 start_codon:yes stop_codon:yes gene_type:complete
MNVKLFNKLKNLAVWILFLSLGARFIVGGFLTGGVKDAGIAATSIGVLTAGVLLLLAWVTAIATTPARKKGPFIFKVPKDIEDQINKQK